MFRSRRRSEIPSLNTSSTADISFMLLIFFLVTSSMDSDKGLRRQLPPPSQEQERPLEVRPGDVLTVSLDAADRLTVDGDSMTMGGLAQAVERFAAVSPHQRIVAVEMDRQTSYDAYFHVQQAIVAAYRRLRCPPRVAELPMAAGEASPLPEKGVQP